MLQNSTGWTEVWDNTAQVPYVYKDDQWISYDNAKSVLAKVVYTLEVYWYFVKSGKFQGQYAKKAGIGGVMIYALEMDDFLNLCGGGTFSLLKTLRSGFGV